MDNAIKEYCDSVKDDITNIIGKEPRITVLMNDTHIKVNVDETTFDKIDDIDNECLVKALKMGREDDVYIDYQISIKRSGLGITIIVTINEMLPNDIPNEQTGED
jgi:hypothetical protein